MFFDRPLSIVRFSLFYLIETTPLALVVATIGLILSILTDYDWAIAGLLLSSFLAHRFAISINFNRYLTRRELAQALGADVEPFQTFSIAAYGAAILGAILGWQIGIYLDYVAIVGILAIFLVGFYVIEVFRRAHEF